MFRFKTKEEFIEEFGVNWRLIIIWSSEMDKMLGQEIMYRSYLDVVELFCGITEHLLYSSYNYRFLITRKMIKFIENDIS